MDAAHGKRLAVCLDVVYDYFGPAGNDAPPAPAASGAPAIATVQVDDDNVRVTRWDFPPDPAVAAAAVFVSRCLLSGQPMPMQEAVECLVGTITDMAEAEAAVCVASLRERVAAAEQRTAAAEQRVATAREAAAAAQLQAAARVAAAELQVATERERAAAAERRAADAETAAARAQSAAAALRATLARVDAAARHNSLLASHEAGLRRHFEHIVWGQRVAEAAQAADIAALGPPVPDRPQ